MMISKVRINFSPLITYLIMVVILLPLEAVAKDKKSEGEVSGNNNSQFYTELNFNVGINELPQDLRDRWFSVIADADSVKYTEYIIEGDLIIKQLGSLIIALGNKVPDSQHPSYGVYTSMKNRLLSTIDKITLKILVDISDVEIEKLLDEYKAERNQTSQENTLHRQELLRNGMDLLRRHQRERFFLKYPHRKAALAGLYYQITELMYQEAYEVFLEKTDEYIEELNRLAETDPAAIRNLKAPTADYSRVKSMYQRIVDEFPTSEYADDALYNIGFLTGESNSNVQKANANRIFETLVSIYPNSDYTLNSLRRIAEYYFMPPANNLEKAAETYTRITEEFSDSPYYQEALYKLGWTYYRLSDLPASVEYFALALDENFTDINENDANVLDIASESYNYIGICYAVETTEWAGAGVDNMAIWLDEHSERKQNYGRDLILQLGDIYRNQIGHYELAVEVYRKYLEVFPLDYHTPEVLGNIVEIYQQGEIYNPPQALLEKKGFFNDLNPDSDWWAANPDKSLQESIIPTLEKYLDMMIDEILILASDQGLEKSYVMYENFSRQYLRYWPKGPNAYKIQLNLATILERNLNRPMEALREYYQVATAYEDTTNLEIASQRVVSIAKDHTKMELNNEIYMSPDGIALPPEMKPGELVEEVIEEIPVVVEAATGETDSLDVNEIAEGDSLSSSPVEIDESDSLDVEQIAEGDSLSSPPLDLAESKIDTTYSIGELTTDTSVVELEPAVEAAEAKKEDPEIPEPTELLNSEKILFSGFDLYLSNFSQTNLTPTILYQAGDIMYKHQRFADSRVYFRKLITDFPGHRFIGDAYTLILEGFFINREFANVEQISKEILEADVSSELKETANLRKALSQFLNASNLKLDEDHIAAADEFRRVAFESPDYEYADKSMFQAGLEYKLGEAWTEANEAFLYIADNYPQSEYADKSLYNAGLNAQDKLTNLAEAARLFEQLVKTYPRSALAQGALAYASSNYNELMDHEASIRVNEEYVALFPDAEDANIYLFENAAHYLKLEQMDRANDIYRRFSQKFPDDPRVVQAFFERGSYFLNNGNRRQAESEFTQTVAAHDRLISKNIAGNLKYASQALSYILRWEHDDYNTLKFTLPIENVTSSIARKKQWRNSLYDKYQQILDLGQKEGFSAYYQRGTLDEELAISTYEQGLPNYSDLNQKLTSISKIVDESLLLNDVATQTFRSGIGNLNSIRDQLITQQEKMIKDFDKLNQIINQMQKDNSEGLADSLDKQRNYKRALDQVDSAILESKIWISACREKIPAISARNGRYLTKLWNENIKIRGNESDEEISLLFREEVLNSSVAPITPEICGFYLQALMVAAEFNVADDYQESLESSFNEVVNIMFDQYKEQTNIAQSRIERYTEQYIEMLPNGEDAESPDGFYPDEMGMIIQDQVDYLNNFCIDFLLAFEVILDTASVYTLPPGFAGKVIDDGFRFVLNKYILFNEYASQSTALLSEYATKYEETDELQYDDAAIAFEDLVAFVTDYHVGLLEEGLRLKQSFNVPTMSGIELIRLLINSNPDQYASQFEIEAEHTSVVSSSDWKIWPEFESGFESEDYFDVEWDYVTFPENSYNVSLGVLDSLNAHPIWYYMDEPTPLPVKSSDLSIGDSDSLVFEDTEEVSELDSLSSDFADEGFDSDSLEIDIASEITDTDSLETDEFDESVASDLIDGEVGPDSLIVEDAVADSAEGIVEIDSLEIAETESDSMLTGSTDIELTTDEPTFGTELVGEESIDDSDGSLGLVNDPLLEMISGEIENQISEEEYAELEREFAIEDSIYQYWVGVDSTGVRSYWMRSSFEIESSPTAGSVWLTADDNYSLFINGVYIAADDQDTIDYYQVDEYDIADYIQLGSNLIALEVSDVDNSKRGIVFALSYESIPDMSSQLDLIVDNEIRKQDQLIADKEAAWIELAGKGDEEKPSSDELLLAKKVKRMLIIEKNKLR